MDRSWLKVWIIAIALVIGLTAAYEASVRAGNYVPTVQDDADLWSLQYDLVKADPHAVALLGASRIQFAVDPALLSELLGGHTVAMLAINGQYPLATLRMLADDPSFASLAVVGVDSRGLAKRHWDMQQDYIKHYRERWSFARRIHREIESELQKRLVIMRSDFSAPGMVKRLLGGFGMPFNEHVVLRPDRVGFIDYRHTNVAAIKARGGRVAFFREPVSDEHLDIDERAYPRPPYWDAYARVAPVIMIDFRDEPALAGFELPDTSHIDGVDVPAFTVALAQALKRRKLLPPLKNASEHWVPAL